MKVAVKLFLIFILLSVATNTANSEERKKKILVLHSYHQGLDWTDNITRGIKSVFDPLQNSYEVYYEYLDTKRNTGKKYMDNMALFISEKNKNFKFEAVIASDNDALELLNEGKITFKGNPPVIFCGVNNYDEALTDNLDQVTGVAETTDLQGTLNLMKLLHPKRNHVLIVLDLTATGNAIREEFRKFEEAFKGKLEFEFLRDFALEELPEKLALLDDNDIIFILTFNRDKNNNFISYTEGIEMISRSTNVPIYGAWDFYLGKGIVGGRITSGNLQGVAAAKICVKVLQAKQIKDIKVLRESPAQYMFDYKYLLRYGIKTSLLPQGSHIINAPPTPYEKYKSLLIGMTGISLSVILLLLWQYMRQRSILEKKEAIAIQLETMVQERTRELEKTNKELQRLSNLDGLTQIHNRHYFDKKLSQELNRMQRTSSPISLLICDIDYFKKYNDTYGHVAGDDCIKIVAKTIQQNCKRISDVTARYGGEEFGVILPNTSPEQAVKIADSILKEIELRDITHEASEIKKIISLSIGVASIIPDGHTTPSSLIQMSDKALYESKSNGRDRVTLMKNHGW